MTADEARREAAVEDDNILLDVTDDDWAWRRRIRSNRTTHLAYRVVLFVVGLVLVAGGLALVPLPGPGWLIVFLGVAVWATEFEFAQRYLERGKALLPRWNTWVQAQPLWLKGLIGLATATFVAAVVWVMLRLTGVPGFLPDQMEKWMHDNLGL